MTAEKNTRKSVQVSTTVSPETYDALREHRFDKRIEKMTDIVAAALADYMVKHNIKVSGADAQGNDAPAGK